MEIPPAVNALGGSRRWVGLKHIVEDVKGVTGDEMLRMLGKTTKELEAGSPEEWEDLSDSNSYFTDEDEDDKEDSGDDGPSDSNSDLNYNRDDSELSRYDSPSEDGDRRVNINLRVNHSS